jgi:hypothetical protein
VRNAHLLPILVALLTSGCGGCVDSEDSNRTGPAAQSQRAEDMPSTRPKLVTRVPLSLQPTLAAMLDAGVLRTNPSASANTTPSANPNP